MFLSQNLTPAFAKTASDWMGELKVLNVCGQVSLAFGFVSRSFAPSVSSHVRLRLWLRLTLVRAFGFVSRSFAPSASSHARSCLRFRLTLGLFAPSASSHVRLRVRLRLTHVRTFGFGSRYVHLRLRLTFVCAFGFVSRSFAPSVSSHARSRLRFRLTFVDSFAPSSHVRLRLRFRLTLVRAFTALKPRARKPLGPRVKMNLQASRKISVKLNCSNVSTFRSRFANTSFH